MTTHLDTSALLDSLGISPRYVALIQMSRRRLDNALYPPTRRERLARHVRLYQRAMKYREVDDGHSL
jgi:hypothetical protein